MGPTTNRCLAFILAPPTGAIVAVLALIVRVIDGSPVFFRQERAGRDGRPFRVLKLRTMSDARDPHTNRLLSDAERLTRLGKWLRSTSLDELPELWNVMKGEMAFVGPRPLPTTYLSRYTDAERRRHEVLPGITGLAQVNGRNEVSWSERFSLDLWYVENRSVRLDLRILIRTALAVLRREGITAVDAATMHELRPELANDSEG